VSNCLSFIVQSRVSSCFWFTLLTPYT